MSDDSLSTLFQTCVDTLGADVVRERLRSLLESASARTDTLTIIANAGVHPVPGEYLRGDVYEASRGNWNISSQQDLEREFKRILVALGRKLQQTNWKRIYLIPTGHPALAIQIKLLVYRVTRINTIDLFYAKGQYYEIEIDHREVVLKETSPAPE